MRRKARRPAEPPHLLLTLQAAAQATQRRRTAAVKTVRLQSRTWFLVRFPALWMNLFLVLTLKICPSGIAGHISNHPIDGATLPSVKQVKLEPAQSNGPSSLKVEPPPILDNNSNGCSQPAVQTFSHDSNGSLEPLLDHRDTVVVTQDRPPKKCRMETDPLGQSEVEPPRVQENWRVQTTGGFSL